MAQTKGILIGVEEPVPCAFLPNVPFIGSFKSFDDLRPMKKKPVRKRRFVRRVVSKKIWDKLREKPIQGIGTLPDGGLVSSVDAGLIGGAVGKSINFIDDVDFKMAKKIGEGKLTTIGAISAIRDGLAVVDEMGVLRCPPGFPGAMQFTNSKGEGCEIPNGKFMEPLERISEEEFGQLDPEHIYDAVRINQARTGQSDTSASMGKRKKISRNLQAKPKNNEDAPTTSIEAIAKRSTGDGFSLDLVTGEEPQTGFVIARKGRGVIIPVDGNFDEDDEPKPEAIEAILKFISANADELAGDPAEGATHVVIGGWKAPLLNSNGVEVTDSEGNVKQAIYFDISDVFPEGDQGKEEEALQAATEIGKERNQQAIFQLSNFTPHDTGGTGADVLSQEELDRSSGAGRARKISSTDKAKEKNPFIDLYKNIEGQDNMNLDSFDKDQINTMLTKLKGVPGFEWIDPENPDHLSLAIEHGANNLLSLIELSTPEEIAKSKRWYDIANEYAKELAEKYNVSEATAAAVLAALSPTADWRNNVVTAEHVLALYNSKDPLPDEFIKNLFDVAKASHAVRNGDGIKSWKGMIEAKKNELQELEKMRADIKSGKILKDENGKIIDLSSVESKIQNRKDRIKELQRRKSEDKKYLLKDLQGKSLSELPENIQGIAVALHGSTLGGDFLGQKGIRSEDGPDGQLIQHEVLFQEDFPNWDEPKSWKMSVRTNEDGKAHRVMVQSESNYNSALAMIRADKDQTPNWEVIDKSIGKGSKVRSFFNNIYTPNDTRYADMTGDTHFFGGATMVPVSAKHKVLNVLFTSNASGAGQAYPLFRAMVISAGQKWKDQTGEDLLPRQVQSITWEAIRALVPDDDTSLKGWVTNEMAQFMRLSSGLNPERPDLAGKQIEFLQEVAKSMQIKLTKQQKKDKVKLEELRTNAIEAIHKKWKLQAPSGVDILKMAGKKAPDTEVAAEEVA